jgi:signal transduction histidine kinase/ActR/RegA family two-component response regulator
VRLPQFLRRSVRGKVTALVVATTLAALVVTAVALIYYNMHDYRETRLAEIRTQAEILGRASVPALAFNDRKEATQDLAILKARPDVAHAALYAADGSVFASYARSGEAPAIPARAAEPGYRISGERLLLVQPVIEDGQRLGTVLVQADYGLRERLLAYVGILGAEMAGALAAALVLSAWLQRAVTVPILRVADAARSVVERRDFSVRVGKTTEDEIGVLADAMNRMLADLEREIDERRGAEEALRIVDRRKDEFLATLAHELRNPLAPVRNALYLLQAEGSDAQTQASAHAIIDRQVRQMVRLVDDLLDVSRITTGKLALRRERVGLRAVATAALEAVEPMMRERGHPLSIELPPAGLTVNADPTRLAQVFLNLLNNAAKFSDPGGHIEFSLAVRDGEVRASVKDSGVGIAPDMIDEIFEMFAQADRSLERSTMGLGVGLSLSRKLVELHGGTLEARSEGLGKGAEFMVRMPAVGVEAPAPARPSAAGSARGARRRVLVVDDNRDFATSLASVLRAMGHEVRVEHDGRAGLGAAESFRPHIAFLDIGMPKLNGYELARRLRALPTTAASILVAVTGWGQASDLQRAKDAGFDEHMVKPVEMDRLEALLGTAPAKAR